MDTVKQLSLNHNTERSEELSPVYGDSHLNNHSIQNVASDNSALGMYLKTISSDGHKPDLALPLRPLVGIQQPSYN